MKPPRSTHRLTFGLVAFSAVACGSVPDDPGPRLFPAKGIIRGTVSYEGPRPCSRAGHIVGNAVIFVFDRRNPPPPAGFATTAVNFADVTGDALFASEPRYTGPDLYCPLQSGFTDTIAASAPFEVAPLDGASYEVHAFFDYTGDFLPEFTIRDLPERGDLGGGYLDTVDALQPANLGNPNYLPHYLPVDVGVASLPPGAAIPDFVIPDQGFVADNVPVTIGAPLSTTRPYFFAQGEQVSFDLASMALSSSIVQSSSEAASSSAGIDGALETDVDSLPILTIPQDIGVLAPPVNVSLASSYLFESRFPHLRLEWGVPPGELAVATATPFGMQVAPFGAATQGSGFLVWQNATFDPTSRQYLPADIPEGSVPQLWPRVVLTRVAASSSTGAPPPMVVIEGITLLASEDAGQPDSLVATAAAAIGGALFDPGSGRPKILPQDHLTVVLRPSAICFPSPSGPGTLVVPHPTAASADLDCSNSPCVPNGTAGQPIAPPDLLSRLGGRVTDVVTACLPTGRYAISVVYPDGQAWTVPNESGVCSGTEGATDYASLTCAREPRPVLYSQGSRAVVEVVAAKDPSYCQANPPPPACVGSP